MKRHTLLIGIVAFAVLAIMGRGTTALAQPDQDNAPKAENPANQTRPDRGQRWQQRRDQGLRMLMNRARFTEKATQDSIIAFVNEQEKALQPLREQNRKLFEALRNDGVAEEQLGTLLQQLRAAAEKEKARREAALQELDDKIGYTKNPRLEGFLTLLGLVGDEASLMGGIGGMGGGIGMFGGPGGGGLGGGGRGGQGQPGAFGGEAPGRAEAPNRNFMTRQEVNELIAALRREFADQLAAVRANAQAEAAGAKADAQEGVNEAKEAPEEQPEPPPGEAVEE